MDWDFWKDNKDAITTILTVLGAIGTVAVSIWAAFKWGLFRWWTNRIRGEVKVFELITDPATLLPKLYTTENDHSPLADHNIKYQPRNPKRDIQAELKTALNRSRYLLVTAPTGYGKTREAGMLAQTMMLEGWRVLRIRTGWLDMPKTLPEELGGNRSRVLIFLDDLNGLFSTGNLTQSPRVETEKNLLLSQSSYHDRLLQVLDMFEGMCTESEIRVIATARSEEEQWKVLEFSQYDRLWKRFERVELPEPLDSAIVNLLEDTTKQADIKGDESDFAAIARKSDGTYRNILLNLRRWRSQNAEVNKNDFTETLNGSWQDIYERAVKKHPAVKYVYNAVDILNQAGIELFLFLVEPTAAMLWGGNFLQGLSRRKEINRALHYLTRETTIFRKINGELTPSDGQVEAKGIKQDWLIYSSWLEGLLVKNKKKFLDYSFMGFGAACYEHGQKDQARRLWLNISSNNYLFLPIQAAIKIELKKYKEAELDLKKITENELTAWMGYWGLGIVFSDIKRYGEAEAYFRKAIELNSKGANIYNDLGNLLKNLKRYDEAESTFRKAIEINPQDATAYSNLGNLLSDEYFKRYDDAEAAYRKAIELNPQDATAYSNLGILLKTLKRYDDAEAAYRKAIELNPQDATAYSNLGLLLHEKLKRYDDAEAAYRKAIELNPEDATAYSNLGLLLHFNLEKYNEAESSYRKVIEIDPAQGSAHFLLGILLRDNLNRSQEAESYLLKATELDSSNKYFYDELVRLYRFNLEGRIKDTIPLFEKMLELDRENCNHYLAVSSVNKELGNPVVSEHLEKANQFMSEDDWYNRACLESVCDNFDLAFEHLQKAAQKEKFNPKWAWEDPDLQWIRNDPRFTEIVGPKPE